MDINFFLNRHFYYLFIFDIFYKKKIKSILMQRNYTLDSSLNFYIYFCKKNFLKKNFFM